MRTLSVQFQPERAATLNASSVIRLFANALAADASVKEFHVKRGKDRGPYVNITITAQNSELVRLWRKIKKGLLAHKAYGAGIRRSCMVMCEGSRGWDNYLLLYHFDKKVPVDVLRRV